MSAAFERVDTLGQCVNDGVGTIVRSAVMGEEERKLMILLVHFSVTGFETLR